MAGTTDAAAQAALEAEQKKRFHAWLDEWADAREAAAEKTRTEQAEQNPPKRNGGGLFGTLTDALGL
jgi:hypothetical protein